MSLRTGLGRVVSPSPWWDELENRFGEGYLTFTLAGVSLRTGPQAWGGLSHLHLGRGELEDRFGEGYLSFTLVGMSLKTGLGRVVSPSPWWGELENRFGEGCLTFTLAGMTLKTGLGRVISPSPWQG